MLSFGRRTNPTTQDTEEADVFLKCQKLLENEFVSRVKNAMQVSARLEQGWEAKLQAEYASTFSVNKAREALKSICSEGSNSLRPARPISGILRFQASSLFIRDCWKLLRADPQKENLFLVTGTETPDGINVLSRIEHIKLEKQSAAYVRGDNTDTPIKLIQLTEKHGHKHLATFHSHISYGAGSTRPSSTDISYQDRQVKLCCPAIGGIFSLDGYVRFFSTWKPFEIEIYGKGVEKLHDEPKEKLFKIAEVE